MPLQAPHFPTCPSMLSPLTFPGPGSGPQPQPLGLYNPGKGPPGSGEAAVLQEVSACVCWEKVSADCGCGEKPPGVGLALKLEQSAGGRGILGLKSVGRRITDLRNSPGVPGLTKEKATLLTCWVALGQSLILSGPQFPQLFMRIETSAVVYHWGGGGWWCGIPLFKGIFYCETGSESCGSGALGMKWRWVTHSPPGTLLPCPFALPVGRPWPGQCLAMQWVGCGAGLKDSPHPSTLCSAPRQPSAAPAAGAPQTRLGLLLALSPREMPGIPAPEPPLLSLS